MRVIEFISICYIMRFDTSYAGFLVTVFIFKFKIIYMCSIGFMLELNYESPLTIMSAVESVLIICL